MYPNTKLIDCLLSDPRGIATFCNIIDGIQEGLYGPIFVRRVLKRWRVYHNARSRFEGLGPRTWTFDELWRSLDSYHNGRPSPPWWTGQNSADLEFQCGTGLNASPVERYGTVRSTEQVFEALSEDSMRDLHGRIGFVGSASPYVVDDDVVREIRALPDVHRKFRIKHSESIPKYGRFFWFTHGRALKAACHEPEPANAVRDTLGLVHYQDGFSPTAVFFRGTALALVMSARPTFADAATNRRFMTRARMSRNRKRSAWGRTANLARLASRAKNCDGLAERIAATFSGTTHDTRVFTLLPLGRTSGQRGSTIADSDTAFGVFLKRHRSTSRMRATLARYGVR